MMQILVIDKEVMMYLIIGCTLNHKYFIKPSKVDY